MPQDLPDNAPNRDRPQNDQRKSANYDPGWRDVRPDEVFEPGRQFRMDQTTGTAQVNDPSKREEAIKEFDFRQHEEWEDYTQGVGRFPSNRDRPSTDEFNQIQDRERREFMKRGNPFDAMAGRDQERHSAGEEMTDAKRERPEPELSDAQKERLAMLGQRWNAEEREISQSQERSRGGGMSR